MSGIDGDTRLYTEAEVAEMLDPGEPIEMRFNTVFLREAVQRAGKKVQFRIVSPIRPALIANGRAEAWEILMPVKPL